MSELDNIEINSDKDFFAELDKKTRKSDIFADHLRYIADKIEAGEYTQVEIDQRAELRNGIPEHGFATYEDTKFRTLTIQYYDTTADKS